LLVLILVIAAYVRFANLGQNPGWYTDEGSDMDIALHLSHGEIRYMSINDSTMLVARPLTMHWLLARWFALIGRSDILSLRILTSLCSWISVCLLGLWGWRVFGAAIGLLAAALLAFFPSGVLYARMGFSYNLLEPLFLIALFAGWEFRCPSRPRWLFIAGLALMAALSINLLTIIPIVFLSAYLALRAPRQLLWFVPLCLSGFALFAIYMLLRAPAAFGFDMAFTLHRFSADLGAQLAMLLFYFKDLLNESPWFPLSIAGLLLALTREQFRYWGYFALFYLFFVLRSTQLAGQGFYMVIDALPVLAIGLAAAIFKAGRVVFSIFTGDADLLLTRLGRLAPEYLRTYLKLALASVLILLIFVFPLAGAFLDTMYAVAWGFLKLPVGLTRNVQDAESVITYLNQHIRPGDVVLASPQIGWAIRGSVADFQQAAAYAHEKTIHFPPNVPRERFIFDPSVNNARYVVVDDLWRDWAVRWMPAVKAMVEQVEQWPLELEHGEYQVYRNPQK
jgi:hypothetical protein